MATKSKLLKLKYVICEPLFEDVISYCYKGVHVKTQAPFLIWQYKVNPQNTPLIKHLISHCEQLIKLKEPLLIPISDYVFDGQALYTIHPFVPHLISLESYLQQPNVWKLKKLWSFVKQLLQLLMRLEKNNLYCGSISTSQLHIDQNGDLRVIHAGIGIDVLRPLLPTTPVLDDCLFLAPELIYKNQFSISSDIYSIGVLCYFFFSRKWPYPLTFSIDEYKNQLVNHPVPFDPYDPRIPDRFSLLIMQCLHSDTAHRFKSISDLIQAYKGLAPLDAIEPDRGPSPIQQNIANELKLKKQHDKNTKFKWSLYALALCLIIGITSYLYLGYVNAIPTQKLPNVVGMPIEHALTVLETAQFRIKIASHRTHPQYDKGTVIDMIPPAGRTIKQNREIRLFLSSGSGAKVIPDLIGRTKQQVDELIKNRDIILEVSGESFSAFYPKNTVITQSPTPNTVLNQNNLIQVTLSKGFPLKVTSQPLSTGFFTQTPKLRTHVYFEVLDGWPSQTVQITYKTKNLVTLYNKRHTAGDQIDLTYKLEKNGELTIYFNGDVAHSETIQ